MKYSYNFWFAEEDGVELTLSLSGIWTVRQHQDNGIHGKWAVMDPKELPNLLNHHIYKGYRLTQSKVSMKYLRTAQGA